MGARQSAEAVENSTTAINKAYDQIMLYGNSIVAQALDQGWNAADVNELCGRVSILQGDLFDWFDTSQLLGVRARVGITMGGISPANRQAICTQIWNYFQTKLRVAVFIQRNLDTLCQDMRDVIAHNMPTMLVGASSDVQSRAYGMLRELDGIITNWYADLGSIMRAMTQNINATQVQTLSARARDVLGSGYTRCCQATYGLRDFAWVPIAAAPDGRPRYQNPYLLNSPTITGDLPLIAREGLGGRASRPEVCTAQINFGTVDLSNVYGGVLPAAQAGANAPARR